jgi:hypothetical protein
MKVVELKRGPSKSMRSVVADLVERLKAGEVADLVISWTSPAGETFSSSVCRKAETHIALCEIAKHAVLAQFQSSEGTPL